MFIPLEVISPFFYFTNELPTFSGCGPNWN